MRTHPFLGVLIVALSLVISAAACMNGYGINEMGLLAVDAPPKKFLASSESTFIWGLDLKANQYYELIVRENDITNTVGKLSIGLVEEDCKNCIVRVSNEINDQGLRLYFVQATSGGNQVQGTFEWANSSMKTIEFTIEVRAVSP